MTVRGVVLENVTITPVAGLTFETTLTATVYGLSGKTVAWTIDGSDFGYTITAVEETVPSGSSARRYRKAQLGYTTDGNAEYHRYRGRQIQ